MGGQDFSDRTATQFAGKHAPAILKLVSKSVAAIGCCLVAIQITPIIVNIVVDGNKSTPLAIVKYLSLSIMILCAIICLAIQKQTPITSIWSLLFPPTYATWSLEVDFKIKSNAVFEIPNHTSFGLLFLLICFTSFNGRMLQSNIRNALHTAARARAMETGLLTSFVSSMIALEFAIQDPPNAAFLFSTAMVLSITICAYQLGCELLAAEVK